MKRLPRDASVPVFVLGVLALAWAIYVAAQMPGWVMMHAAAGEPAVKTVPCKPEK